MHTDEIEELIRDGLPGNPTVTVTTQAGDTGHTQHHAVIVAEVFEGETLVAQHDLVRDTLEGYLTDEIHAIELTTRTPAEGAPT